MMRLSNEHELMTKDMELLGSNEVGIALQAVKTIKNKGASAVPVLIHTLEHTDDESLRTMAVVVLGELGEVAQDAVPVLARLLEKDDEKMRMAVALTLSRIGQSSLPVLQESAKSGSNSACFWSCWAMTFIDPTSMNRDMIDVLNTIRQTTKNPIERIAAEEALGKVIAQDVLHRLDE
jgi:HEAT repeat protein